MHPTDDLSPFTGWSRTDWCDLTDRLIDGIRSRTDATTAMPALPGPQGGYGHRVDSLEAFARSMQLAAFRLSTADPFPEGLAEWYRHGLTVGSDPDSPHRWPTPLEAGQAKVEACSIALALMLAGPDLWDPLSRRTKQHLLAWFEHVIGAQYPASNWVWFQLMVEAFLRQKGGRWSADDVRSALAVHENLAAPGGWYHDEHPRSFDHYSGWALQTYPFLVDHVAPDLPGVSELRSRWRDRIHAYLDDAVCLVGADGSPLIQGRSLIYRFGAAAPFWTGALADATPLSPGLTRRVASGMVAHFIGAGVTAGTDLLDIGWFDEFLPMKQAYSGPGSPYWAGIGMLGLLLQEDHPVWTAVEEPLPVERGDFALSLNAPGWLVSGTSSDGVVRIVNHGTDNANAGSALTDSPWYARLGYSTVAAPELTPPDDLSATDNEAVLLDTTGRSSSRTGFDRLALTAHAAVSSGLALWITPHRQAFDYGAGQSGRVRHGPYLTVGSVLRGSIEIRACRVDPGPRWRSWLRSETAPVALRISGAAVATDVDRAGRSPRSAVVGLSGLGNSGTQVRHGTNQMTSSTAIPWVSSDSPVQYGRIYVAAVFLQLDPVVAPIPEITVESEGVAVRWPDGEVDVLPMRCRGELRSTDPNRLSRPAQLIGRWSGWRRRRA